MNWIEIDLNWIESWLTPNIGNSDIFPEQDVVFRKERVGKTGGGVLIAVNKTYISSGVKAENNNCELISSSKTKKTSQLAPATNEMK